jgi:hypothetical protein
MKIRTAARAACSTLVAFFALHGAAAAQRGQGGPPAPASRVHISGWGGYFTSFGGFADEELDAFFRFDSAPAFGGGLHAYFGQGFTVGVDALYGSADYERRQRTTGTLELSGDAKVAAGLLSARLAAGGGGRFALYISGGIGAFAYELDAQSGLPDGWDTDFALYAGGGLEFRLIRHLGLFGEYGQLWAYHQKAGSSRNVANHALLRGGLRVSL